MSKNLAKTFGGAAAMISLAGLAPAQVVPARRDSIVTKVFVLPGRMDSILIVAGRIAREDYGSPAWIKATAALDSLIDLPMPRFGMRGGMAPVTLRAFARNGWVGLNTQGPAAQAIMDSTGARRVRYFGYQDVVSVDPGSPAEHVGIKPGDVLVAYNGTDLIGHEFNLSDLFAPKKHVDLSVRRAGEVKEYSLIVAAAPLDVQRRRLDMEKPFLFEMPASGTIVVSSDSGGPVQIRAFRTQGGRGGPAVGGFGQMRVLPQDKMIVLSPNGMFGASLTSVNDELSKVAKLQKGVLVIDVHEDTPAFRAGLRIGDVIVTADDDSVATVSELRDLVIRRFADRSVALQVVRKQKTKKLVVSWDSP
jgi:serine protease Do